MLYILYLDLVSLLAVVHSPTFWDIIQKRDVQRYSAIPYVCTLLNCVLWVVYCLPDVALKNPRCQDQPLQMLDRAHLYKYILGVCTQKNSGTSPRQSHGHVQASFQSSFCLRNSSKYNQATGDSQRIVVIEIMLITNCFDLMQSSCPSLQTKGLKLLGAVVVFYHFSCPRSCP